MVDYLSTPTTQGPTNVDYTYSLALPEFNPSLGTLTGAAIYFFAEETIGTLTLYNVADVVDTFEFSAISRVPSQSTNSAHQADAFSQETLDLFNQTMTLGPDTTGTCPESTASSNCSSVSFTPHP